MRTSDVERTWAQIHKYPAKNHVTQLDFTALSGIKDEPLKFTPYINAIVGFNGSGKTTLLNCVRGALDSYAGRQENSLDGARIQPAELFLAIHKDGIASVIAKQSGFAQVDPPHSELDIEYIETASQVPALQQFCRNVKNLDEQLKQHEALTFGRDDRDFLSYLVGKDYSAAKATDLADDYVVNPEPADVEQPVTPGDTGLVGILAGAIPVFEVTSGGVTYGSAQMGLGELALFYLYWRIRTSSPGALLLIEEPESFVAPRSQENLMNVIASLTSRKLIWTLISTHSEHIIERLPAAAITILARDAHGEHKPRIASGNDDVLMHLRLDGRRVGTIFVEDWAGFNVLQELIANARPDLLRRYKIIPAFGDGNVVSLTKNYPRGRASNPIIGVLDADSKAPKTSTWPCLKLPGSNAPEIELVNATSAHPEHLAKRLGKKTEVISDFIGLLSGDDHHDFVRGLGEKLGIGYQAMIHHLVWVWLQDAQNRKLTRSFLGALYKAIEHAEKVQD